jgi:hypothetical protein
MADNPDQPAGLEKYVPTTSAAVYLSRRNAYYYNGTAWTKGGLQLESAAATNQAPYSNDFSQWTASGAGVAVTASASNGPLGASTMSKVEAAGGSAPHYIRDLFSIATGNNTFAYWVKSAGEGVHPQIRATGEGGGFAFVNFDIDNGTVGNSGGSGFVNADIFDFGGGVYLIYGVINHTASGDGALLAMCETPATDGELPTFNNNGAGFYVSGAQVEAGSIPTSHIPTSGSTVPRAAETLSIAQANYPTADDATPHWFLIDVRMWDENTRQDWLNLQNNTSGFRLRQEQQKIRVIARTPADGQEGLDVLDPTSTEFTQFDLRLAHRFTTSEHGGSANGESYVSTALTEVPAVPPQDLDLTADDFHGFIREIRAGLGEPATTDLEAASA